MPEHYRSHRQRFLRGLVRGSIVAHQYELGVSLGLLYNRAYRSCFVERWDANDHGYLGSFDALKLLPGSFDGNDFCQLKFGPRWSGLFLDSFWQWWRRRYLIII